MKESKAPSGQVVLREIVLLGINRLVVTSATATFKVPGVYVQEVPSGVAD